MVPVDYMIRSALGCDTLMSRAMLRACGVPVPRMFPRIGAIVEASVYGDIDECFSNHASPMDGRSGATW